METDYKKLCKELFLTEDVGELKEIAKKIKQKNLRNAGRKRKLNDDEIKDVKMRLANGEKIDAIAKDYQTSRQIITKSISEPCNTEFPLQIKYMYGNKICTLIYVNFADEIVKIENRTDDILHKAFGIIENPTWKDFEYFLNDRCFPKSRYDAKNILRNLQIDSYDTLQIVEKTEGRMAEDNMHLKFKYYEGI